MRQWGELWVGKQISQFTGQLQLWHSSLSQALKLKKSDHSHMISKWDLSARWLAFHLSDDYKWGVQQIQEELSIYLPLHHIERSQLRGFGYLERMSHGPPPFSSVPGSTYWEETTGQTQDPLVWLHLPAGPRALWDPTSWSMLLEKRMSGLPSLPKLPSHPKLDRWMVAVVDCPLFETEKAYCLK